MGLGVFETPRVMLYACIIGIGFFHRTEQEHCRPPILDSHLNRRRDMATKMGQSPLI
jgi:hypothetical protein